MTTPEQERGAEIGLAINERPILFSGEMVRAILDGRKTQTRRVVKPIRDHGRDSSGRVVGQMLYDLNRAYADRGFPFDDGEYRYHYLHVPYAHPDDGWDENGDDARVRQYAPWEPGDRLWVREAWCEADTRSGYAYRADVHGDASGWGWRPSIHMPRRACRLVLEVESVRVERLHSIRGGDGKAEGYLSCADFIDRSAWCRVHWDTNPWVWVVTFKPITKEPMSNA